jgi:hypothetical protein
VFAKCGYSNVVMLIVVMLNDAVLSVVILSVVMVNVVAPSFVQSVANKFIVMLKFAMQRAFMMNTITPSAVMPNQEKMLERDTVYVFLWCQ